MLPVSPAAAGRPIAPCRRLILAVCPPCTRLRTGSTASPIHGASRAPPARRAGTGPTAHPAPRHPPQTHAADAADHAEAVSHAGEPAGGRKWPRPGRSTDDDRRGRVALTFDDGPDPITPRRFSTCSKHRRQGDLLPGRQPGPGLPGPGRRIAAEGHTLCNHSLAASTGPGQAVRSTRSSRTCTTPTTPSTSRTRTPRSSTSGHPGGNFNPGWSPWPATLGMRRCYWSVDTAGLGRTPYGHGSAMVNHIIGAVKSHDPPGRRSSSPTTARSPTRSPPTAPCCRWLKSRRHPASPLPPLGHRSDLRVRRPDGCPDLVATRAECRFGACPGASRMLSKPPAGPDGSNAASVAMCDDGGAALIV